MVVSVHLPLKGIDSQPLMNVGVVGLQEPRISVTLYTSKTYLLSAMPTPTLEERRIVQRL